MRNQGLRDKISLDARKETHPEFGEKVSRDRKMMSRYIQGETVDDLCEDFGLSRTRFYQIANRYRTDR